MKLSSSCTCDEHVVDMAQIEGEEEEKSWRPYHYNCILVNTTTYLSLSAICTIPQLTPLLPTYSCGLAVLLLVIVAPIQSSRSVSPLGWGALDTLGDGDLHVILLCTS